MAEFTLSGRLKVKTLKAQFKANYGSTLRVYNSISCDGPFADDNATLASIRAEGHRGGDFEVRGNMLVGNFEKKVAELFGIGVQVASPDDKYLVDNSISLTASGRIENNEVAEQEVNKQQLTGRKQRIRVEIQIAEHDYAAFYADGSMVGDTYAFNGDDGYEELKLYVDDEEYDFGDDEPQDVIGEKYSDYKKFDLEQKWADEEVGSIGYYNNMAFLTWEFDVDDFDINKLTINYDCNDVCYESADYNVESHILSLSYDGKEIDTYSYGCSDGDLETIWYNDDEEDYDEEDEDYDDKDDKEDEAYIKITPDTVIDDIYVKFTLKYPHLHLRFLSKSGEMEEVIDSSKTVGEIRKMLKTKPKIESGEVQIGEKCVIEDVCKEFNKYGIGDTWVCCHYGEDKDPEPHGSDRTLALAEKDSVEDAPYMIAGMRKITEDGEIIEETPMSLSEKFGILAATMAGIDDKVEKEEIDMILGIVRQNSDVFDIAELRTALLKELNGIREYESQSAIVRSIQGIDREAVFQALVMVAVADFKLTQDELSLLSGIADLWEWEWDDCASVIRNIINSIQEANGGKEVEIEE